MQGKDTPNTGRKLLNGGVEPHKLTKDEMRRGQAASAKKRRERRALAEMSVRDQLAELCRQNVEVIAAAFFDAVTGASPELRVRAAQALLAESFGRPHQALTGAGGGPIQVEHVDVAAAREKLLAQVDELAKRRAEAIELPPAGRTGTDG